MIRKQSMMAKIKSAPFDILLWLNEMRLLIAWDEYAISLALPMGISLMIVVVIIQSILNYYESINGKSNNLLFNSDYVQYEQLKTTLINGNLNLGKYSTTSNNYIWSLQIIVNILSIGSLITSWNLFTTFREYGLLYLTKNSGDSSSLIKKSIKSIPLMISKLYNLMFKENQLIEENVYDNNDIWILKLWNPSKFSLFLFIGYNPINIVICLITDISLPIMIILLIISLQNYCLIYKFSNLIQDKQILNQELMKEYTNKFVKPYTSKLKKDVQINSTLGPYKSTVLMNPKGYVFNKLKVFTTHDLKGNQVQQFISNDDDKFQSFEEYTSETIPKFDSSQLFNQSSSKNIFPKKNWSYTKRKNSYFDEQVSEEDSDSDDWYVSSTPYKNDNIMQFPNSRSRSRSPFKSPIMKPKTIFNTSKFTSPHPSKIPVLNATPLPYTSPARSPNRSPYRSPNLSPSRSPNRSPTRSFRSSHPSSRDQSPNRTYLKSPSPSKRPQSESSKIWR